MTSEEESYGGGGKIGVERRTNQLRERANDPFVWKTLCAQDFEVPVNLLSPGNMEEDWKQIFFNINDDLPTAISSEKPLADGLSVGIDGLSVTYNGIPGADQVVFGNSPLCPRHDPYPIVRALKYKAENRDFEYKVSMCDFGYYEVTIQPENSTTNRHRRRKACIAVGLARENFPTVRYQPGWKLGSYGFHSDDGRVYHNGKNFEFDKEFEPGDTIGCGWNSKDKYIFFTKNGKNLGIACLGIRDMNLFPVVGIDAEHTLKLNFGAEPFMYDINSATYPMDNSRAFEYADHGDETPPHAQGVFGAMLQTGNALVQTLLAQLEGELGDNFIVQLLDNDYGEFLDESDEETGDDISEDEEESDDEADEEEDGERDPDRSFSETLSDGEEDDEDDSDDDMSV